MRGLCAGRKQVVNSGPELRYGKKPTHTQDLLGEIALTVGMDNIFKIKLNNVLTNGWVLICDILGSAFGGFRRY